MKFDPAQNSKRYRIRIDLSFDSVDDVEARKAFEYVDESFKEIELDGAFGIQVDKTVSLHEIYPDKAPRSLQARR